jgi:hypothetical protein
VQADAVRAILLANVVIRVHGPQRVGKLGHLAQMRKRAMLQHEL